MKHIFYIKNNYYIHVGTRLLWGTYSAGEIFENLLQLKRFGLYFEGILCRKWRLSYRNNDISYRDARGFGDMLPEKILK